MKKFATMFMALSLVVGAGLTVSLMAQGTTQEEKGGEKGKGGKAGEKGKGGEKGKAGEKGKGGEKGKADEKGHEK